MTSTSVWSATQRLLAEGTPANTGPDFGKASPFGLLVVVLLLAGTFALVWSMNRHLKRLPESFDPEHPEPDQAVDEGTVAGTSDGAVGGLAAEDPASSSGKSQESGAQPPG